MYQLSEQNLFDLLRNSFIAGEVFSENTIDVELGEKQEITEPDFDEYHNSLDLTDYEIK